MFSTRSIARFSSLLVLLNLGISSNAFAVPSDQTALALERVDQERVADLLINEDSSLPKDAFNNISPTRDSSTHKISPEAFAPVSAANITIFTAFSPSPIKKNLTVVDINTEDGHSGSGIAFQQKGFFNLPYGQIKCAGKIGFPSGLDWSNFTKPYPLYSGLYIWGGAMFVQTYLEPAPARLQVDCRVSNETVDVNVALVMTWK
ncbi:uncharacterized protein KY384_004047 [Bacidia gigantensis]|uniref:uncharacterized protein n=1 Tax=Bacidia gigantensis TaxID=2732470 RepID=UPI001D04AE4B|nr:uncharacterized protein KY384_004047 [Bacidia gigantensis]KAG8530692.1 hypothetical protein KY384_004047 [Bacidia gigantensis]